jgi:hypothetical protein
MSYDDDDDEIAEGGEQHEIEGNTYSVVGNTVYKKDFWGKWKPVEDVDEEAEAGDHREINNEKYSIVGDKVYRQNWLYGWDEVTDEDERAEAGDREDIDGSEYSRVGDSIYRKRTFGGWKLVEDIDEEAEAGDHREINGYQYSIVGDTVYKKGIWGTWHIITDLDECAEAGEQYESNGYEYSRVGDLVFRKRTFGGWRKLKSSVDEDSEEEDDDSEEDGDYEDDVSDDSTSNYSRHDSYSLKEETSDISYKNTSPDPSSDISISTLLVLAIIAVIAFVLYTGTFPQRSNISQVPNSNSLSSQQSAQTTNPYGAGMGNVTFYKTCSYCDNIEVYSEGSLLGIINDVVYNVPPRCSAPGTFAVVATAGITTFTMKNEHSETWEQQVNVTEGECIAVRVIKPPIENQIAEETSDPIEVTDRRFEIITPTEHSEYDYPRYTDVEWGSRSQADSYEVELQLADAPYDYTATSFGPPPYANGGIYKTFDTNISIQGMGKQVHRLRVKAIVNGQIVEETPWRYFNYRN